MSSLKWTQAYKKVGYAGWLLMGLKLCLFLGFLYLWDYWTAMLLFFRDNNQPRITDYMFTLVFNSALLLSCFRCHILLRIICLLLLAFTTYLYLGILLNGKVWGFACIGCVMNFGAVFLIWYNWTETYEKITLSKD